MTKNKGIFPDRYRIKEAIGLRLSILIIGFFILQSSMLFFITSMQVNRKYIDEKKSDMKSELVSFQETLQYLAINNDDKQIQRSVALLGTKNSIKGSLLIDNNSNIIASTRMIFIGENINRISDHSSQLISADILKTITSHLNNSNLLPNTFIWLSKDRKSLLGVAPIKLGRLSNKSIRADKTGLFFIHYDMKGSAREGQVLINEMIMPMLLILALFGFCFVIYFNKWISKRLQVIGNAAKKLSMDGNHSPIKISGHDEISELGHIFNTMTLTLQEEHARLQRSQENLDITLHSIGDAVITTDIEGNVTRMNPEAERLTGYQQAETIGKPIRNIFAIIDASTRKPIRSPIEKVISTGETVYLSNHTTLIAKDGTEHHISDSAAAIKNQHNEIHGMVLIFNDVSEEYRLRSKLRDSLNRSSLHWKESPLGMIEWSIDFTFIDINPAAEKIFSINKKDIIGKHTTNGLKLGLNNANIDKAWKELIKNGASRHDITKNITADGRTITCDWYNTPLINEQGIVIGVSSLVMDITEQHRLKGIEKYNQKLLQNLLDGIHTMLVTLKKDGTVMFANKPPLDIVGCSLNEFKGLKLWQCPMFIHSKEEQKQIKEDCSLAAKGKKIEREIELSTELGKTWIDFNLHPVCDDQGDINYLIAEARDASKRKAAEEHLIRNQKMQALSQIVAGIAHDYNNMLGVIVGYSGLLKRRYGEQEEASKFIDEIIHAANRGKQLTRKMVNFSQPESHHTDCFNLNNILGDNKDILAKALTSAIQLHYNLSEESWQSWIDEGDFQDALLNLAINAQYSMPEGGTLTIITENIHLSNIAALKLNLSENDYIKLTVSDIGCGIKTSLHEKIFEPFFSTKGKDGNGLGLSQVYAFTQRIGGTITVQSELAKGTTFDLYFPRYRDSDSHSETFSQPASKDQLYGHEKILVVDDDLALRDIAREILQDAGYSVLTANDGQQALEILTEEKNVALVLSDVVMPNMDGLTLSREINAQYSEIEIQLLSGFIFDHSVDQADSELVKNIIFKPYSSEELLIRLRQLLDSRSNHIENIHG